MKKIKAIFALVMIVVMAMMLTACRQANRVSYNISKEADNFNVTRRLVVINARSDKPVFELVGNFSLKNNSTNELQVICEVARGEYKKHYIYLNQWTLYFVEDISGAEVDQYRYEVNFLPEMLLSNIAITMND